jgi:hypothetical protein
LNLHGAVTVESEDQGRAHRARCYAPRRATDEAEALAEASDCLSTALAGRINRDDDIPSPSGLRRGRYLVAPDATMALKAALYNALRARKMTIADLARRLDIYDRKAARLIDPRAATGLTSLEAALSALGYAIAVEVHEKAGGMVAAPTRPDTPRVPRSRARPSRRPAR